MNIGILIREAKEGFVGAKTCLFNSYAPQMLIICRRFVRNREDAEEIMMDGFYNFFEKLDDFNYESDAGVYKWIKRIMVFKCIDHMRREKSLEMVAIEEADEITIDPEVYSTLSAETIFKLICDLPSGCRTVFNLYVMCNMSHKEIARELHISESTSKSQYAHAKKTLQKRLTTSKDDNEQEK